MLELRLNGTALQLTKGTYKESYNNVDKVNTSEGGNTLRAVTRTGILTLNCSYTCDGAEKVLLDIFAKAVSLNASIFSEESGTLTEWLCYMTGYSADLIVENGSTRFYKVTFTLNDLT